MKALCIRNCNVQFDNMLRKIKNIVSKMPFEITLKYNHLDDRVKPQPDHKYIRTHLLHMNVNTI